ncbi:MAG: amino acid ABC transporter permease [Alphaproteobacteria bacterium]|nr:amino acid ABC transporter permease [Alphaproteobacteria bacterium]
MTWDWAYALRILPDLLHGVLVTVLVTAACAAIALVGGLLVAVFATVGGRAGRFFLRAAVDLFRGVPILVLLYFGFYALPQVGIVLPAYVVGVLVLGAIYAAYCSEVYRGALITTPPGIRDACAALGLSAYATWRKVQLPLAIRKSMPALINYVVVLYKQSAFLFAIGVPVLLAEAQIAGYQHFRYLEPYTLAGLLYLLMNLPFVFFLRRHGAENARILA